MYLGIDLGGTKTEAVVLDEQQRADGEAVLFRRRLPTPQGDYAATLEVIAQLVSDAEQTCGRFDSLGIGTPGAQSAVTGAMKNCNSTCLNGRHLVQDLEQRLGRRVFQANDANCFALSEATDGAGQGADVVFGVILGTGVGGGIVVHGRVLQGVNRISGEWGHNPMPAAVVDPGDLRRCYCGKVNCVETFLSGAGLVRSYQRRVADGELHSAEQIAAAAQAGQQEALTVLQDYSRQLAAALAGVINLLDPDVIVLGGGLSQIAVLYQWLPEQLAGFVFSDSVQTRVLPPVFGDASGVRGAAWLNR